ncbi:MAG: hypothetical protein ACK5X0_07435 [Rhodospirillales bacterium]|jgi:hypothetical protein
MMPIYAAYHKALCAWLEAHGRSDAAAGLSKQSVTDWQDEGMSIAEAANEAVRLMSVLELVAK